MPFEDPATAVCFCNFCGNPLRFQPLRLGEVINCVHCGMETALYAWDIEQPHPKDRSVTVQNVKLETNDLGQRTLVGEVVNDSAGDLNWIRIEFMLYDKTSLLTAVTSDSHFNLLAGTTWAFRAPVFHKEAIHASLPIFSCEHGKVSHADNFECDFVPWRETAGTRQSIGANPPRQG